MLNIGGELCDEREVSCLSRGSIRVAAEREYEWLVIGIYVTLRSSRKYRKCRTARYMASSYRSIVTIHNKTRRMSLIAERVIGKKSQFFIDRTILLFFTFGHYSISCFSWYLYILISQILIINTIKDTSESPRRLRA